jgi:hypothetical protein
MNVKGYGSVLISGITPTLFFKMSAVIVQTLFSPFRDSNRSPSEYNSEV